MRFDDKKEHILLSNNQNLDNRWSIVNPDIIQEKTGLNRKLFKEIGANKTNKTCLHLGYDNKLKRPVTIKTVNYLYGDLENIEAINKRRLELRNQLEVLNDISSPLLPEPLDWFEIQNNSDEFPDNNLNKTEPVLVLEYQPGISLRKRLLSRNDIKNKSEKVRMDEVNRIATNILYFMMDLEEKEYVHLGLCPNNIIMLKDENIRIIGLSKIYKTNNSRIKVEDIKCSKVYGYSAPELYSDDDTILDSKALLSFSLGVLIHQLVCGKADIHDYMVKKTDNGNGFVFNYPNDESERFIKKQVRGDITHKLICDLCNPDPKKRLVDYDEIEKVLSRIGGGNIKQIERTWVKKIRNRRGKIKSISENKPEMIIKDDMSFVEYTMYIRDIDGSIDKKLLNVGSTVEFDIAENKKGRKKAVNIRLIKNTYSDEDLNIDFDIDRININKEDLNIDFDADRININEEYFEAIDFDNISLIEDVDNQEDLITYVEIDKDKEDINIIEEKEDQNIFSKLKKWYKK